jgi:predicted DNA-binding transcriptional regulator YafY
MTHERYVTASELAELMAVSVRTIKRMTAAGMPSETLGMGHMRRYLPSQAMGWAAARATMTSPTSLERRANAAEHEPRRR